MPETGTRTNNLSPIPTAASLVATRVVDGVPISGKIPVNDLAMQLIASGPIGAVLATGTFKPYATRATLYADLVPGDKTVAWVYADPVPEYDGVYQKVGATTVGNWSKIGPLPYSFATAAYTEAGTLDAIQAESDVGIREGLMVLLYVEGPNTSTPVTVSFNGGAPLTIKTASGQDVPAGALVSGMGIVSGSDFRLQTDISSAGIQAAAAASAAAAAASAALITMKRKTANYTCVSGESLLCDTSGGSFTLTLPLNPSAGANVRVIGNGWETHNLTVGRNGQTIDGDAENLTCDYDADLTFIFIGGTWSY